MATKSKAEITMNMAALQGEKELQDWLDQHPIELKYPDVYPKNHKLAGQPHPQAGQVRGTTAKACTVQTAVPVGVYVKIAQAASELPDGMSDGDLADGSIPRIVRRALLPVYMPELADVTALDVWEDKRAKESALARGERLSQMHVEIQTTKKKAESLEALLKAHAASNPELAAALAAMDTES